METFLTSRVDEIGRFDRAGEDEGAYRVAMIPMIRAFALRARSMM